MNEVSRFDAEKLGTNYSDGPANVESRFRLYEFAENNIDIHDVILEYLQHACLKKAATVLDVGCSAGEFLVNLRYEPYNHAGPLYGVDPYPKQFPNSTVAELNDIVFLEGWADAIPRETNSVDVVTELFMRYHVPDDKQQSANDEVKRVLKPGGVFVLATSGDYNKVRHRIYEQLIARRLGVMPPTFMNEGYDTEAAIADLPDQFRHVLHFKQHGLMVIDTVTKLQTYMSSLRSLRNQYEPSIALDNHSPMHVLAAEQFVEARIRKEILLRGRFLDFIMRDVFFCSDKRLKLPVNNLAAFKNIARPT